MARRGVGPICACGPKGPLSPLSQFQYIIILRIFKFRVSTIYTFGTSESSRRQTCKLKQRLLAKSRSSAPWSPHTFCVWTISEAKIQGVVVDEVLKIWGGLGSWTALGTQMYSSEDAPFDFVQYSTWKYNRPRNTTQEAKSEIARTAKYSGSSNLNSPPPSKPEKDLARYVAVPADEEEDGVGGRDGERGEGAPGPHGGPGDAAAPPRRQHHRESHVRQGGERAEEDAPEIHHQGRPAVPGGQA